MANEQLNDYIKQARQSDASDEQMKIDLLKAGWQADYIKEGFQLSASGDVDQSKNQLEGLRGWLALLGISLIFLPLTGLYSLYVDSYLLVTDGIYALYIVPGTELYLKGFNYLFYFETVFGIGVIFYSLYLLYLYFTRSKKFPRLTIILLIIIAVVNILDVGFTLALFVERIQANSELAFDFYIEVGRTIISAIVWSLYLHKSERVKNTFIH